MKDGSWEAYANQNNVQLPPGIRIPGLFFFANKTHSIVGKENAYDRINNICTRLQCRVHSLCSSYVQAFSS